MAERVLVPMAPAHHQGHFRFPLGPKKGIVHLHPDEHFTREQAIERAADGIHAADCGCSDYLQDPYYQRLAVAAVDALLGGQS